MKRFTQFVVPVLALTTVMAACENKDTTEVTTTTQANVRFINALQGSSNLALTANGNMVGSSLAFGTNSQTCTTLSAGSTSFAFGVPATSGTGIQSAITTFNNSLQAGGNYTIIATGTTSNPSYILLNNTATTTAPTGFANVRFVNATGTGTFDVYSTASGATLTTPTAAGIGGTATGMYSSYIQVPITSSAITFTTAGSTTPAFTTTGSFTSGGNYTVVLLPSANGTGYQSLVLNGTC